MREGYQITELGEIPLDWVAVKFKDIASNSTVRFGEKSGKCIDLEHLEQNSGKLLGWDTISNKTSTKNHFKKGDILFGKLRPYLRKFWFAEFEGGCSTEIMVFKPKTHTEKKYLFYIVQQDSFIENAISNSFGTKMPRSSWSDVAEYNLVVPPLPEQQKIAAILSTVDEKIEVIDAQITQTRELKKGLMQKLLTRGIGHTKFQDSVLGEIPKSWEVSNLESHSHFITKGSTPTTYGFEWQESGITFLRSECVSPNGFSLSGAMHISEEANKAMERSKIKGGDILMTITGNVGRTCIYPMEYKEGNINQHIARIRISDSLLLPQFVFQYLSQTSIITEYLKITTGQAYPQLSLKQVRETKIPLPSIEEQQKIALILSTIDEKLKIQQEKKTEYQQLKKGLMQQLLTGKVRVLQSELEIA